MNLFGPGPNKWVPGPLIHGCRDHSSMGAGTTHCLAQDQINHGFRPKCHILAKIHDFRPKCHILAKNPYLFGPEPNNRRVSKWVEFSRFLSKFSRNLAKFRLNSSEMRHLAWWTASTPLAGSGAPVGAPVAGTVHPPCTTGIHPTGMYTTGTPTGMYTTGTPTGSPRGSPRACTTGSPRACTTGS